MSQEYKLPNLGEGLEQAEVVRIDVKEGDTVADGDTLLALETDKAVMDVPARFSGSIEKVLVKEGDSVKTGQAVVVYSEGKKEKTENSDKEVEEKPKEEPVEKAPAEKEEEKEGEKEKGEEVKKEKEQKEEAPDKSTAKSEDAAPAPASPAVRKLARELGVDLHQVSGSAGGRITDEDVKQYVRSVFEAGASGGTAAPALPDFSRWGKIHSETLKGAPKAMARGIAQSWSQVAHVTQHDEADVTALESARRQWVKGHPDAPKLTMTVLAMRACVKALGQFPQFNASIDPAGHKIIYKDYCHIGIAVDSPHGLTVPVLRDADKKNLLTLAVEIADLAGRVRDRKISADEMQGSTFTISNLGGIGGTAFTPIVDWPNVAILGISRIRQYDPAVRLMLPLSLSYDHRLIDGAGAARFVARLCQLLGNPLELMLDENHE